MSDFEPIVIGFFGLLDVDVVHPARTTPHFFLEPFEHGFIRVLDDDMDSPIVAIPGFPLDPMSLGGLRNIGAKPHVLDEPGDRQPVRVHFRILLLWAAQGPTFGIVCAHPLVLGK